MKESIYQLALRCKSISDEKMGTDRNIFPFKGIVFTDYTVKGPVDEYLKAIEELCSALTDRIIKVAQSYREYKNGHTESIDEKTVNMLSVKNIEECTCVIAKEGIGYYLEHHMDNQLMAQKYVKDKFLVDKCNEELINPFLAEMMEYYG